jgi:hypothetical protein
LPAEDFRNPVDADVSLHPQSEDLVFAKEVLQHIGWSLSVRGLPRIWRTASTDTIEVQAEHSRRTIEALAESATGEVAEGLDLAQQMLHGLTSNIRAFGNARVNLRKLGVDDTIRSTDFVERLLGAENAITGFIEETPPLC